MTTGQMIAAIIFNTYESYEPKLDPESNLERANNAAHALVLALDNALNLDATRLRSVPAMRTLAMELEAMLAGELENYQRAVCARKGEQS